MLLPIRSRCTWISIGPSGTGETKTVVVVRRRCGEAPSSACAARSAMAQATPPKGYTEAFQRFERSQR